MSREAMMRVSDTDAYNAERDEKIRSLTKTQKVECLVEKDLLSDVELNALLYESDLTLKQIEEIIGV